MNRKRAQKLIKKLLARMNLHGRIKTDIINQIDQLDEFVKGSEIGVTIYTYCGYRTFIMKYINNDPTFPVERIRFSEHWDYEIEDNEIVQMGD